MSRCFYYHSKPDGNVLFGKKSRTWHKCVFTRINMQCRRMYNIRKQASPLTGFIWIWPDSLFIIPNIVGRFGINLSGAIGPGSLGRRNHVAGGWAMLSVLRSVLIVGYRSMTAMVILPWECGRDIARSGVQDRKSISRLMLGSDMS